MKTAYAQKVSHGLGKNPISDATTPKGKRLYIPFVPDASTTRQDLVNDARIEARTTMFAYYKTLALHQGCLCRKAPKYAKQTTCWQEFNHLTNCLQITWIETGDIKAVFNHLKALNTRYIETR